MSKITSYAEQTVFATNDVLLGVDVSDTTMAATGTTKKVPISLFDGRYLRVSNNLSDVTASTARTNLGLVIGTDVQAYDADLAALAGLTSAANKLPYFTGAATAAVTDLTAFGRSLIDDADAETARTTLGLVIGTNVQAYDSDLATIAGLTATTDNFIVSVSSAWASRTPTQVRTTLGLVIGTNVQAYSANLDEYAAVNPTTAGLALLDDADAAAQRTTLGLGALAVEGADTTALTKYLRNDAAAVWNEAGADIDFRMEGDTDTKLVYLDAGNNRIGIGTDSPDEKFHVIGNFQVDDAETAVKGYRFRTSGSDLDLDASGKNLYISNYSGAGFTGTQRAYIKLGAEFDFVAVRSGWEWKDTIDGTTQHSINSTGSVVFNEQGNADYDFRVESDTYDALFVDSSNNSVMVMGNALGKVGFYGTAAIAKQTGVAVTAAGIHAALVNLGLIAS